jgi:hypothetical protein
MAQNLFVQFFDFFPFHAISLQRYASLYNLNNRNHLAAHQIDPQIPKKHRLSPSLANGLEKTKIRGRPHLAQAQQIQNSPQLDLHDSPLNPKCPPMGLICPTIDELEARPVSYRVWFFFPLRRRKSSPLSPPSEAGT